MVKRRDRRKTKVRALANSVTTFFLTGFESEDHREELKRCFGALTDREKLAYFLGCEVCHAYNSELLDNFIDMSDDATKFLELTLIALKTHALLEHGYCDEITISSSFLLNTALVAHDSERVDSTNPFLDWAITYFPYLEECGASFQELVDELQKQQSGCVDSRTLFIYQADRQQISNCSGGVKVTAAKLANIRFAGGMFFGLNTEKCTFDFCLVCKESHEPNSQKLTLPDSSAVKLRKRRFPNEKKILMGELVVERNNG